ncbi:hypothetical protein BKA93DRAFT_451854 [Sparassis latifolia]
MKSATDVDDIKTHSTEPRTASPPASGVLAPTLHHQGTCRCVSPAGRSLQVQELQLEQEARVPCPQHQHPVQSPKHMPRARGRSALCPQTTLTAAHEWPPQNARYLSTLITLRPSTHARGFYRHLTGISCVMQRCMCTWRADTALGGARSAVQVTQRCASTWAYRVTSRGGTPELRWHSCKLYTAIGCAMGRYTTVWYAYFLREGLDHDNTRLWMRQRTRDHEGEPTQVQCNYESKEQQPGTQRKQPDGTKKNPLFVFPFSLSSPLLPEG